jgi:hypothetical protein
VPAKERLWRDEEGAPAPSRQQPREGGEDRPIHRAIGDAHIELALEDAHLVAEHHDLVVLVCLGPPRGSKQAEDPAQAEVTEGALRIELKSRAVHILGITDHPDNAFVTQMAANLAGELAERVGRFAFSSAIVT